MAVEESSSQDATLIDDDLVAALGFEPVVEVSAEAPLDESTEEIHEGNGVEGNGVEGNGVEGNGVEGNGSVDLLADVDVADVDVADVDVADVDVIESVPSLVDDTIAEEATAPVDRIDLEDLEVAAEDEIVEDVEDIEVRLDGEVGAEAEPLEAAAEDEIVEDVEVRLDAEVGAEAEPLDPVVVDDVAGVDGAALDLDERAVDELDPDAADRLGLIDLDQVDLTNAPALDDAVAPAADEVHQLADADSVFADVSPEIDRPVFDVESDLTETVPVLQPSEEVAATATTAAAVGAVTAEAQPRKRYRRIRARKTRRVVRHIDPWSVLTFSVLFHMVVFAALLLSSVLVWNAAIASGMVENVESFIQELGDYETFEINADVMFRAAIVVAGMLTLASSVLVVLLTVVFNLISDLVGGIRVTVIEEETVRVPLDKKRRKAASE